MSKRDNSFLLEDMLEACIKIKKYTNEYNFDTFIKDDKTIDAVIRNFEIIGEASNRISTEFKGQNPEIEWDRIRGFRNRIVHEYFGIDNKIVWSIIQEYLPELHLGIERLLRDG